MNAEPMNPVTEKIAPKRAPKVSVCVVTYNQEKYIRQCLQSLVDQVVDFDFEILVADDCSTDATRDIILDIAEQNPQLFRLFLHEKNIGAFANFRFVHERAAGRYIAHMDGDDYALPGKLQAQANFLDVNKECNISFHRMIVVEGGRMPCMPIPAKKITHYRFYRKDIIRLVTIGANSSKMYRALNKDAKLPDFDLVDYTFNVIQVGGGYAAYCCDAPLGVYRKGIGISGSPSVFSSVCKALDFFSKTYPECGVEINASAWGWLLSGVKHKRSAAFYFAKMIVAGASVKGFFVFIKSRSQKKAISK